MIESFVRERLSLRPELFPSWSSWSIRGCSERPSFPSTDWQSDSDWLGKSSEHPDQMWQCSSLSPESPARASASSSSAASSSLTSPGLFVPSSLWLPAEDRWQAGGVPGGFDLQKSWYRWKREAWTFSRPAWTSDPLAAFLVMRHPALWRFRSPAGFHRSRPQQQQLVSLISPAPSVLCLNVHKNSCCRVWWRLGLEFVWLKVRTRRKTVQESIVGL